MLDDIVYEFATPVLDTFLDLPDSTLAALKALILAKMSASDKKEATKSTKVSSMMMIVYWLIFWGTAVTAPSPLRIPTRYLTSGQYTSYTKTSLLHPPLNRTAACVASSMFDAEYIK